MKGRLWACLPYLGMLFILVACLVRRKNALVRYHLKQSAALLLFKYLNTLFLVLVLKVFANDFGNQGLILLDVFLILGLTGSGIRNAWRGQMVPLPVFGE